MVRASLNGAFASLRSCTSALSLMPPFRLSNASSHSRRSRRGARSLSYAFHEDGDAMGG